MTVGDLFSGIGGFSLAARWVGWETKWFAEIDPYCSKVLAKHWPGVPNLGDLTKVDWSTVEPVDVLCGGFPCQDISNAKTSDSDGEFADDGLDGKRSGLWSEYARAIGYLRPRYAIMENVAALFDGGVGRVLGDLAEIGYDAEGAIVAADWIGAEHARQRAFVVAYPDGIGRLQESVVYSRLSFTPLHEASQWELGRAVRRADGKTAYAEALGVADGIPRGLDDRERITALGNAIVPQVALHIFRAIQEAEEGHIA